MKQTWERHGHSDSITDRKIRTSCWIAVLRAHPIQICDNNAQLTTKRVQHLKTIVQRTFITISLVVVINNNN